MEGLHLGAQLYVSRQGAVLANLAFGEARPGLAMSTDTRLLWLSSGKPLTAVAIAQLWAKGELTPDDPVARYLPDFFQNGKEAITIRHLLTHTAGIRGGEKCDLGNVWPEIIDCVCRVAADPGWTPGERAAYQPSASWYVLGEIVRRVSNEPVEDFVTRQVLRPCRMEHSSLALPAAEFEQLASALGIMYHTDRGAPVPHRKWNTPPDAALCRPGRSARGPVSDLGQFYEMLLQVRQGSMAAAEALSLTTPILHELVRRQRVGLFDETFQHVIDWGLGFCIDSKRYGLQTIPYGYGPFCSEETFGHSGAQSSCAFADPGHGLVVAWAFNGVPGERRHQQRARELNSAIYQDLGLV